MMTNPKDSLGNVLEIGDLVIYAEKVWNLKHKGVYRVLNYIPDDITTINMRGIKKADDTSYAYTEDHGREELCHKLLKLPWKELPDKKVLISFMKLQGLQKDG